MGGQKASLGFDITAPLPTGGGGPHPVDLLLHGEVPVLLLPPAVAQHDVADRRRRRRGAGGRRRRERLLLRRVHLEEDDARVLADVVEDGDVLLVALRLLVALA